MRRRNYYVQHKNLKYRMRWFIIGLPLFFLIFVTLTSLFFSMRVLENEAMAPNLRAGERFVFSSYGFYSYIPWLGFENDPLPFGRGHIVLVNMFNEEETSPFYRIMDTAIRIVSAQRLSLMKQNENYFVKRVIGLPGDEITMTNYLIRVRTHDSAFSLTEFELTEQDYTTRTPTLSELWDSSLPFSGNMDRIVLGSNEVFLLSDDRSNTNDSRTWGPVQINNISGKLLFRYWPLNRLGRP